MLLASFVALPTKAQVVLQDREPEAATGVNNKDLSVAREYMVSSANPYATRAGQQMIEQGGNAVDAVIAVQVMLSLVEPQSSGIGGGAFIMFWDEANSKLHTVDGREVAPKDIDPYLFHKDGKPMGWRESVVGGKSVGVPGVLKALEDLHTKFGQLEWEQLFQPTIKLATEGFIVSPRLARLLALDLHPGLNTFAESIAYFKPNGVSLEEGLVKTNPKLANTLKSIAEQGSKVFYSGEIAKKIVKAVNTAEINAGTLSLEDLSNYQAIERQPMCNSYRAYQICGMAPPSSGGVTVYQILKSLEAFDLSKYSPTSPEFIHLFTQASALAFADRAHFVADLDYMNIDPMPLVNLDYLKQRASLIGLDTPMQKALPGNPYADLAFAKDDALELDSTSHISIVDKQGNAVSMTSSIEFMFGSGIMVEGFLLNNQLTDFSISPKKDGKFVLNRAEPGKRPRSAMSPTMVFDKDQELSLVVGSPGGSRIINYVAQTLVNVLDFKLDIQSAIDVPRITNRNDVTSLEKGSNIDSTKVWLEGKGHEVKVVDLNSGLHGVQVKDDRLLGGADPRREGIALGK